MPWYSGFLSQSEDMHVKLTGSKLEIEVNLSVNGCLSHCVSSENGDLPRVCHTYYGLTIPPPSISITLNWLSLRRQMGNGRFTGCYCFWRESLI